MPDNIVFANLILYYWRLGTRNWRSNLVTSCDFIAIMVPMAMTSLTQLGKMRVLEHAGEKICVPLRALAGHAMSD